MQILPRTYFQRLDPTAFPGSFFCWSYNGISHRTFRSCVVVTYVESLAIDVTHFKDSAYIPQFVQGTNMQLPAIDKFASEKRRWHKARFIMVLSFSRWRILVDYSRWKRGICEATPLLLPWSHSNSSRASRKEIGDTKCNLISQYPFKKKKNHCSIRNIENTRSLVQWYMAGSVMSRRHKKHPRNQDNETTTSWDR